MGRVPTLAIAAALFLSCSLGACGRTRSQTEVPRFVEGNGRHALLVDGAPFLILGAQANSSSNYPSALEHVWPAIEQLHANTLEPFAVLYDAFAPIARAWARLGLAHPTWGVAKPDDNSAQTMALGRGNATVRDDQWQFGGADWTWMPRDPSPLLERESGGAMVAELGEDEYLVFAQHARIEFALDDPGAAKGVILDRVEEGHFVADEWVMDRVWNGDQTDYGLNVTARPRVLRVTLATY